MKKILIVAALLLVVFGLKSQDFDKARMDNLFARIDKNQKGMGSVSIFKNGSEVYHNSFGYADMDKNILATAKTKYRIGSISKSFTATIIMQLIDEKKLTLQSKLDEYFPEIPNAEKITIEQLLRHRSGLFNFTNSESYEKWMEAPKTKDELVKIFVTNGTVFNPDEKSEYSNTNFVLLSFIAEKIDNKSFANILKDRIIEPLKLNDLYYGGKISTEDNEALSYTKIKNWKLATETDMSIPVGAGAIVANPTDLNSFYVNLFTGKMVTDESLSKMKKIVDNFGMGMFNMPFYERSGFGHTGGIDGFQSNAIYFPNDSVSVTYLSNGVETPLNDILVGILSIYFGKEYEVPEFKPGLELKSEELDQYLGVYSSETFPLKITISKEENVLIAQATGQPSFVLEAYEIHIFKFDQAKLKLEFIPAESKMILMQHGAKYELTRE